MFVRCKQVWVVTGYNTDRHDRRAGGSELLGIFKWVAEQNVDAVVTRMEELYGPKIQVMTLTEQGWEMPRVPTVDEEVAAFVKYIEDSGARQASDD